MTVDPALASAITASLRSPTTTEVDIADWLTAIEREGDFAVVEHDLRHLRGWGADPATGDITHASGRFFAIRGVETGLTVDGRTTRWQQPAIDQSDIGVLGLLGSVTDGVLRLLVQAKMEPGNARLVQVSPTVQATASNFERVHQGTATPYLEFFGAPHDPPAGARFLVRQEQSEQGTRYLGKRNLNAIAIEEAERIDVTDPRFRWLTLADLLLLARGSDLLHMDTRSILGSLPLDSSPDEAADTSGILTWVQSLRARVTVERSTMPLDRVEGWGLHDGRLQREDPSPFSVVGVRVSASSREVTSWDQPLVHNAPGAEGILLVRRRDSGGEVLVTGTTGLGVEGGVELGPSRSRWPHGEVEVVFDDQSAVDGLEHRGAVVFDNDLPEEGGRFLHSSVRHVIVDVTDAGDGVPVPDGSRWLSLPELRALGRSTSLLNMELRSLVSCLPAAYRGID